MLVYFVIIGLMSVLAFFAYWSDKRRAKKGKWRIKESVLLGLGIFGGAIGALAAMNCFRHKTRHWYFWAVNVTAVFVHIALAVVLFVYIA